MRAKIYISLHLEIREIFSQNIGGVYFLLSEIREIFSQNIGVYFLLLVLETWIPSLMNVSMTFFGRTCSA